MTRSAWRPRTGLLVAGGHALLGLLLWHSSRFAPSAPGTPATGRPAVVWLAALAGPGHRAAAAPAPAPRSALPRQPPPNPQRLSLVAATATPSPPETAAPASLQATTAATADIQRLTAQAGGTGSDQPDPAPAAPPHPVATVPPARTTAAEPPLRVSARADRQHCPPAAHPALLRERGIEGAVTLRVRVDPLGRAADVQLLAGSGWRLLDEAALRQARGCRFHPATHGGEPVDSWVEFPVRFTLAG